MNYLKEIEHAINYIEINLMSELTGNDVAKEVSFSKFHFHRIFLGITGETITSYIRRRRLEFAAKQLIESDKKIIEIAFECLFENHESFTRAFKKNYGILPTTYRKRNTYNPNDDINIHQIMFNCLNGEKIMEPKFVKKESFKVIGMRCLTTLKDNKIPELWQKFLPRMNEVKNRTDKYASYGICETMDDFDISKFTDETQFNEFVGVEVKDFSFIPEGMEIKEIGEKDYAVFTHKGPVFKLHETYCHIYGSWLLNSGFELDKGDDFEYYDYRYKGMANEDSEIDIYVPIKKQ